MFLHGNLSLRPRLQFIVIYCILKLFELFLTGCSWRLLGSAWTNGKGLDLNGDLLDLTCQNNSASKRKLILCRFDLIGTRSIHLCSYMQGPRGSRGARGPTGKPGPKVLSELVPFGLVCRFLHRMAVTEGVKTDFFLFLCCFSSGHFRWWWPPLALPERVQ